VQQVLCAAQIGLGVALLATAGLIARGFWELNRVEPGFDASQVVGFNMSVPNTIDLPDRVRFYARALEEIQAIPGVERAGLISFLPPETRAGVFMGLEIEGAAPTLPGAPARIANTLITSPGYFETMRMSIVRGRGFTSADTGAGRPVLIVNEAAVRRYFDSRDPIGRRVGTGFDQLKPVREVVGVVRDTRDRGAAAQPIPTVYIPFEQFSLPYGSIAIRAALDPAELVPIVRDRLTRLNADVPLTDFQTVDQRIYESLREPRFYMVMAAACAGLAVAFVTFGLYGLISYSVSRRSREIGIRMALGAGRRAILALVLRQGLLLAAAGIAAGIALAMGSTKVVKALLFQVQPMDPLTLAGACALVVAVTLVASLIPARRASAINPVAALKQD
jgi:putative ABC transport system permease protein